MQSFALGLGVSEFMRLLYICAVLQHNTVQSALIRFIHICVDFYSATLC